MATIIVHSILVRVYILEFVHLGVNSPTKADTLKKCLRNRRCLEVTPQEAITTGNQIRL